MIRIIRIILREMVREMARLPLLAKIGIGLIIPAIFVVVTQWERLTFRAPPILAPPKGSLLVPTPEVHFNNFHMPPSDDKIPTTVADATPSKRLARLEIADPKVQADGSILGGGETLYLYGIMPFNSKAVCVRASGDRWACGLHAYATLRNSIAKKTIVCDPQVVLPSAVNAVCRLGTTNVALMLVRDGLVQVDENVGDAEMIQAQAFAKSKKLGIWDR